ncbi:MAG: choline ABC transporter substrate-binding protein [Rhodospirillales bacterium]|nr:choline ABC transporter substrate-binding protein [Rhodospirillales bacterium]
MRRTMLAAAAGALLGLAAPAARAADPASCKVVRLSDISWTDVTATTALTGMILKDLGYQPKITVLSVPVTYQSLKNKNLDVFLGNWMPSMEADRKPFVDDRSVDVLNANLEGAKYTLAVPQYLYDNGLHDFSDIQKFGKDLSYRIYGIEPGNDGNRHVLDLIKENRWGLGKFQLVESSEQGMLSQLEKDYRGKKPIVFLGWEPHPMNTMYRISYLTGGDDTFGPNFGGATVYTNVRAGYAQECPNVARLLQNEKFSLAGEDEMMNLILNKKMDPAKAVAVWARKNRDAIRPWLDGVTTADGKPGWPAIQSRL